MMGKLGKPQRRIEPLKVPVPEKESTPSTPAPEREREKEPART